LLSQKNYDLDCNLTAPQRAERDAYTSLIEGTLYNLMLYNWWGESENREVTKAIYKSMFIFPLNFISSQRMSHKVLSRLNILGLESTEQVTKEAEKCYEALAVRLANNSFFFGDKPSSIDATLYGHLSCQLAADLPVSPLSSLIKRHHVLVNYCTHLSGLFKDTIFSFEKSKSTTPPKSNTEKPQREENSEEKKFELKSFMFAAGAIGLMVVYTVGQHIQFLHE